jgi:hypothetical protein
MTWAACPVQEGATSSLHLLSRRFEVADPPRASSVIALSAMLKLLYWNLVGAHHPVHTSRRHSNRPHALFQAQTSVVASLGNRSCVSLADGHLLFDRTIEECPKHLGLVPARSAAPRCHALGQFAQEVGMAQREAVRRAV